MRLLTFECTVAGAYGLALTDSGASASFISTAYARSHGITVLARDIPPARLADDSTLSINGVTREVWLRIGPLAVKQRFLVLDMPGYDIVLGLDFLSKHEPDVRWRKRCMFVRVNGERRCIKAFKAPALPGIHSDNIELCNIDTLAKTLASDGDIDPAQACVGVVLPEQHLCDPDLLSGKGADHPKVAPLLQEFADVLKAKIPGGLPPVRYATDGSVIEHTIDTAPTAKPYARNPHPFTQEEDAEVKRYISTFLENGWIRPSLSPSAAPVLFVPKKPDPVTGKRSWRMCISYVALNAKTLNRIAYRLPRISELLARLSKAKFFSKLDLLDGFYQVRVRDADVGKTAFTTPYGNYEFKVMPMGLCGAPSTFQYLMDETFRENVALPDGCTVPFATFIAIYLDDVCIFSVTEEEHLTHIRAVLQRLREHHLFVKPSKCEWLQTTIEFLGHMVDGSGQFVNPQRAAALQNWPVPQDVPALRSLLGTFGFWRDYIAGYARITAPLTNFVTQRCSLAMAGGGGRSCSAKTEGQHSCCACVSKARSRRPFPRSLRC